MTEGGHGVGHPVSRIYDWNAAGAIIALSLATVEGIVTGTVEAA